MDLQSILTRIQPFLTMFVALVAAFLTATWVAAVIWAFRDIRARSRDIFVHVLATLLVLAFFPLFPVPGLILYWILRPRDTLAEVYERTLEEEALLSGIEERVSCPQCSRQVKEDFSFCPNCHVRLKKACVACGRQLHLQWSLCPYCGASQSGAGALPGPAPAVILTAGQMVEGPRLAGVTRVSLPEPDAASAQETGARNEPSTRSASKGDSQEESADEGPVTPEAEPHEGHTLRSRLWRDLGQRLREDRGPSQVEDS